MWKGEDVDPVYLHFVKTKMFILAVCGLHSNEFGLDP